MRIPFSKMHGLGNDFVVIDARDRPASVDALCDAATIRRWSDRKRGIGFDQWLIVTPARTSAVADYRVFNADGGEVEQCGNGVRCVAALVAQRDGIGPQQAFALGSLGGTVTAELQGDGAVRTSLPPPRFEPGDVGLQRERRAARYEVTDGAGTLAFAALSVGNPHAVIVTDQPLAAFPLDDVAGRLRASGVFVDGVNVGVARIRDASSIDLRVNERGVGETRACGTGAAAAAVVALRDHGLAQPLTVQLPGGRLVIDWRAPDGAIAITGPARLSFEGYIEL